MSYSRRRILALVPDAALAAAFAHLLPACGPGQSGGLDGTVTLSGGKATLPFSNFPALQSAGGGVVVAIDSGGALAVVRTSDTAAIALSAICTHQGCYVEYQGSYGFSCPCHGAQYSSTGVVTQGPAQRSLAKYAAAIDASGITVTVG